MDQPLVPFILTTKESIDLRYAKSLLENPGFAARLSSVLGTPIEKGMKMLPKDWTVQLNQTVRKALFKALDVAVLSIGPAAPLRRSEMLHKILAGASGGIGG